MATAALAPPCDAVPPQERRAAAVFVRPSCQRSGSGKARPGPAAVGCIWAVQPGARPWCPSFRHSRQDTPSRQSSEKHPGLALGCTYGLMS